jgi:hypothetical protein
VIFLSLKHTDWLASTRQTAQLEGLEVTIAMNDEFTHFSTTDSVDAEYCFGRPKVYLAGQELARLSVLRSRLGDTHAERLAHAAGMQAATRLSSANRLNPL